jgi:hypothetical protein
MLGIKHERYEEILDSLVGLLGKPAAAEPFSPEGLRLKRIISDAGRAYHGVQHAEHAASASTLHELGEPLPRVIMLLKDEDNREQLLIALGAPRPIAPMTWDERDRPAVDRAAARLRATLDALNEVSGAVPPPPTKPPHRPSKTKDLRAAVNVLAEGFERMTGEIFTEAWHKGEPLSRGAQFIYYAMKLIDPTRLRQLRMVTADFVRERNASKREPCMHGR